jgi:transposase-like protein
MTEDIRKNNMHRTGDINSGSNYTSTSHYLLAGTEERLVNKVANRIEGIKRYLYERDWYIKGHKLFTDQQMVRKRECIAIDARETIIGGEKTWIWAAVDLSGDMVIAVYVSYLKDRGTTSVFLRHIAKLCSGTLPKVFINGENWDQETFKELGFRYTPVSFGTDSVVEKFLSAVDRKIGGHLEELSNNDTVESMQWWMEGAAGYTNYWTTKCKLMVS